MPQIRYSTPRLIQRSPLVPHHDGDRRKVSIRHCVSMICKAPYHIHLCIVEIFGRVQQDEKRRYQRITFSHQCILVEWGLVCGFFRFVCPLENSMPRFFRNKVDQRLFKNHVMSEDIYPVVRCMD